MASTSKMTHQTTIPAATQTEELLRTTTIGQFVRVLRDKEKQRAFAQKLDLSDSRLSQIETGQAKMSPNVFSAMIEAYPLAPEVEQYAEQLCSQRLVSTANSGSLLPVLVKRLAKTWSRLPTREQARLYQRIVTMLDGHDPVQHRGVAYAVIPAAGWQAALGSAETAKLIVPCIEEALACEITHFVLIRNRRHVDLVGNVKKLLGRRTRNLEISDEIQEKKDGLARAVQLAVANHSIANQQAFALLLPDDHVESECLQTLIQLHKESQGAVVALKRPKTGEKYSGIAWGVCKRNAVRLQGLSERPRDLVPVRHYSIVGRYILDCKVIAALDDVQKNESTNRYELTDALNMVAISELSEVLGYVYHGKINSIHDAKTELLNKIDTMFNQRLGAQRLVAR